MINIAANTYICLSNDFMRDAFLLIRSVAELSELHDQAGRFKKRFTKGIRAKHFFRLLLMTKLVAIGVILERSGTCI